ncbi:MAG: hypothetical protein C4293_00460, partial [Nitrospiraceae bacterium]
IIAIATAVNLFALNQMRQITAASTELVSKHYPAIESAKWLEESLYAQLRSEKKYLAVNDEIFLKHFDDDAREFRRMLTALLDQEIAPEGQNLLKEAEGIHDEYRILFHSEARFRAASALGRHTDYEARRDAAIDRMSEILQSYVELHEAKISTAISDSRKRSEQVAVITKQLMIVALLLGLGLAGLATYSIVSPLRRLQDHIREIGQGNFGTSVKIDAPSDLQDLVESVGSMSKRLQELDDMKAEFVSHITHELRSPLTAIHAGTQLLLEEIPGPVTREQRETLQLMVDSSRQLIDMISSLLDLSKIQAGMMEYHITSIDLSRVLETSINKVRLLANREHIRIVVDAPRGPLWVPADDLRIQQVLDNLLSNAIKFSREGTSIHLKIEVDQKTGTMLVSVSDTGRGIPSESLPYIFDRFYQGSLRANGVASGSGIGLALAKKVVEAHGGKIWAESELGKGTTMKFVLPLKRLTMKSVYTFCRRFGSFVIVSLIFTACSPVTPSSSSPDPSSSSRSPASSSSPFFTLDPLEAKFYRTLIREQEGYLNRCAQDHSCDRAHFTRALTALYEDQAVAAKHFREIVRTFPQSPLAPLSDSWLRLLQETPSNGEQRQALLSQMTHWLIRDVFYKEQLTRQELTTRDKKLAELSAQIEALKQIDREIKEKSLQIRPRAKGLSGTRSEDSKAPPDTKELE